VEDFASVTCFTRSLKLSSKLLLAIRRSIAALRQPFQLNEME
jgi:hypothetical protein